MIPPPLTREQWLEHENAYRENRKRDRRERDERGMFAAKARAAERLVDVFARNKATAARVG